jgi:gliding motility-associated-like protein
LISQSRGLGDVYKRQPYTYHWSCSPTINTAYISNLCPGIDTVIVTDACGFSDTTSFIVPNSVSLVSALQTFNNPCSKYCDISSKVVMSSGYPAFLSYNWSNGSTSQIVNNLCHNSTYYCIVKDSTCGTDTLYVTTGPPYIPPKDSFAVLNGKICPKTCLGSASFNMSGGYPPYHYYWFNSNNTTASINNLCPGNYYCFSYDQCGSIFYNTFNIDTLTTLTDSIKINYNNCINICNNDAQISVSGGMAPYTILWSNGISGSIDSNLCPGTYQVYVSNPSCVSDTILAQITILPAPTLNTSILQNISCYNSCDGIIKASPNNMQNPFAFIWNNSVTDSINKNVCAGTYVINLTDARNCVVSDTIQITQPSALKDTALIINSHCQKDWGSILDSASGGTPPYTYLWSNGQTTQQITQLYGGVYIIEIKDANNCIHRDTFKVLTDTFTIHTLSDTTIHSGNTVYLYVKGADSVVWLNSEHIYPANSFYPTWKNCFGESICVIGFNQLGCTDTACFEIRFEDDCGKIECPKAFSPNGDGINDHFKPLTKCITAFEIQIYDRWGNLVYVGTENSDAWDGTYKNQALPNDVFVWILQGSTSAGNTIKLQGNLSLLR